MDSSLVDVLALLRIDEVPLDQSAVASISSAHHKVTNSQGGLYLVLSWTRFFLCYPTILKSSLSDGSPIIISTENATRKHLIIQTTHSFINDNLRKV